MAKPRVLCLPTEDGGRVVEGPFRLVARDGSHATSTGFVPLITARSFHLGVFFPTYFQIFASAGRNRSVLVDFCSLLRFQSQLRAEAASTAPRVRRGRSSHGFKCVTREIVRIV